MKVCVLITALNEERAIASVVSGALKTVDRVVVVDDGSTDSTAAEAEKAGATVLQHEENQGKGVALRTGFRYMLEQGCDAIVTMDGDGQHSPEALPRFLEVLEQDRFDIVVGTRERHGGAMPFPRNVLNSLSSAIVSRLAGTRIRDSQSGYRLLRREVLERVKLDAPHYEMESEILIKAGKLGYRIGEVPIDTIYGEEESKFKPRFLLRFLPLFVRMLCWKEERGE